MSHERANGAQSTLVWTALGLSLACFLAFGAVSGLAIWDSLDSWSGRHGPWMYVIVIIPFAIATLSSIYLIAFRIVRKKKPDAWFVSTMADVTFLGAIALGGLVSLGFMSVSYWYVYYGLLIGHYVCLVVGWIWILFILAMVLFETIYVLKHFGTSRTTWRKSFGRLTSTSSPSTYSNYLDKTEMAPMMTAGGYPAVTPFPSSGPSDSGGAYDYEMQAPSYQAAMEDTVVEVPAWEEGGHAGSSSQAGPSTSTVPSFSTTSYLPEKGSASHQ